MGGTLLMANSGTLLLAIDTNDAAGTFVPTNVFATLMFVLNQSKRLPRF